MAQLKVIADKLNKRRQIPNSLPDSNNISGIVFKDYSFEGTSAGANALGDWYVDHDNNFYWGKALLVSPNAAAAPVAPAAVDLSHLDLPVNHAECLVSVSWMNTHFGDKVAAAVAGNFLRKGAVVCYRLSGNSYLLVSLDQ